MQTCFVPRISILTFLGVLRGQGQTTFIFNFFQSLINVKTLLPYQYDYYYTCMYTVPMTKFTPTVHVFCLSYIFIMYIEQSHLTFASRLLCTIIYYIRVLFSQYLNKIIYMTYVNFFINKI